MQDPFHYRPLGWRDDQSGGQSRNDEYHELNFRTARSMLMPAAKSGERWATLRMLKLISEAIADRCRIPQDIAEWFAPALFEISCGETVEDAFCIPRRKRGEGKERSVRVERGRRYMMAYHVEFLRTEEKQKRDVALRIVAEAFGLGIDAVLAAYRDNKKSVRSEFEFMREAGGKVIKISLPSE
jgi:hypothetical protein